MASIRDRPACLSLRSFGIRFAAAGLLAILFLALMAAAGHAFALFGLVAILPGMLLGLLLLPIADLTQVPRRFMSDAMFEGPGLYRLLSLISSILFWWGVAFVLLSRHEKQNDRR